MVAGKVVYTRTAPLWLWLIPVLLTVATSHDTEKVHLPFGSINVVVLTDVHSWIAGHARHDVKHNANYGHVLSFYEQLQNDRHAKGMDLFFVMNGDFIDGTGLSTYPPNHLTPLLQQMPWDAINIGNHELYRNSTMEFITQPHGFIDSWKGRYLTSNVVYSYFSEGMPLGSRYRILEGPNTDVKVLSFGFLYNFTNNCKMTRVEPVQHVVASEWFLRALEQENFDAVMVLAHMDVQDPLVYIILKAIRNVCGPEMPVQFITGHTHYRGHAVLDDASASFEAGHYLDTVGFVSFPTLHDVQSASLETNVSQDLFQYVFVDANIDTLGNVLQMEDYMTPNGISLSQQIQQAQDSMGLDVVLGCAPQSFLLNTSLEHVQSLWGLYLEKVIGEYYFQEDSGFLYIQNVGAFRYDLFQGPVTVDDLVSVSPYNDTIYMVASQVKGSTILQALGGKPNAVHDDAPFLSELPPYAMAPTQAKYLVQHPELHYDVFAVDFDVKVVSEWISNVTRGDFEPILQVNEQTGLPISTSTLWKRYIQDSWPCEVIGDANKEASSLKDSEFYILAGILVSVLVVVFGGILYVWNKNRHDRTRQYEEAVATAEEGDGVANYNSV